MAFIFNKFHSDEGFDTDILGIPTNVIEVKAGVSEITGKRYNTIADAITYVNTQSRTSILDFWNIVLLDKTNTESFTLPDYCGLVSGVYTDGTLGTVLTGSITLGKYSVLNSFLLVGNTITITGTQAEPSFFYYNYLYSGNIISSASTTLDLVGSFLAPAGYIQVNGQILSMNSVLTSGGLSINSGGALYGEIAKNDVATILKNGGQITVNSDGAFYDNGASGLTATSVGDAIDEIVDTRAPLDDGTSAGQMAFWDGSKWTYTETSELFWDDTNKRVGIGTDSPETALDVVGEIKENNREILRYNLLLS